MKSIITATLVAAITAAAGHTVVAQGNNQQQTNPAQGSSQTTGAPITYTPNKPDPTDKGGVFTLTGCLEQEAAKQGSPTMYKLTGISPATGEARMAGAMGVGTPMGTQGGRGIQPSDPPDIVPGEYRIVAGENVALAPHANHRIEVRGSLAKEGDAGRAGSSTATSVRSASAAADRANDVFIATSVRMISDTCSKAS